MLGGPSGDAGSRRACPCALPASPAPPVPGEAVPAENRARAPPPHDTQAAQLVALSRSGKGFPKVPQERQQPAQPQGGFPTCKRHGARDKGGGTPGAWHRGEARSMTGLGGGGRRLNRSCRGPELERETRNSARSLQPGASQSSPSHCWGAAGPPPHSAPHSGAATGAQATVSSRQGRPPAGRSEGHQGGQDAPPHPQGPETLGPALSAPTAAGAPPSRGRIGSAGWAPARLPQGTSKVGGVSRMGRQADGGRFTRGGRVGPARGGTQQAVTPRFLSQRPFLASGSGQQNGRPEVAPTRR